MNHKESMEKDNMVKSRVGNSLRTEERERDKPMRRTRGLQARGIFKEVPKDPLYKVFCYKTYIIITIRNFFLGALSQPKILVFLTRVSRNFGDLRRFAVNI